MTVSSQIMRLKSKGNGVSFEHHFKGMDIFTHGELVVIHLDSVGAPTILTEGTGASNYAVFPSSSLADGKSDGYIVYPADESTALPLDESLIMVREMDLQQAQELTALGDTFPEEAEDVLDKLALQIQFLEEQINRCVKLPLQSQANAATARPAARKTYRWGSGETEDELEEVEIALPAEIRADFTDLDDVESSYTGFSEGWPRVNFDGDAIEFVAPGQGSTVLHVRDVKAGIAGGTPATATWTGREVNTTVTNTIPGASIGSNQITLPAGVYEAVIQSHFYRTDGVHTRLRNTTAGSTALIGMRGFNTDGGSIGFEDQPEIIAGVFTLTATSVLEVQYYADAATGGTSGLGIGFDVGDGTAIIFLDAFFRKVG